MGRTQVPEIRVSMARARAARAVAARASDLRTPMVQHFVRIENRVADTGT